MYEIDRPPTGAGAGAVASRTHTIVRRKHPPLARGQVARPFLVKVEKLLPEHIMPERVWKGARIRGTTYHHKKVVA